MAFYQSLAYEASAGSGKTFALVIRYISLLYLDAKPNTILTLTFTNKAANEMKVRISTVLKELHLPKRQAELEEISKTISLSKEEILQRRENIYANYLISDLKISTIDKFFAQILRLFSTHLGFMPDFQIEEIEDENKFIHRFLSNVKRENAYKSLVLFSTQESKRLHDIFRFLEHMYTKESELSAIEIDAPSNLSYDKEVMILVEKLKMLFSDICPDLSKRAQKTLEITNIEDLLSKSWLCKDSFEYWDYKKCYHKEMDNLLHEIKTKLALYFLQKDDFLLAKYFKLYQLYKLSIRHENIASNTLGFNDITNSLYELLHQKVDSDFLYFRLDSKIEHLLIDEFQDTNIVQFKILYPIIHEIHAGIGTKALKTFFYVGDIKQSIYRFRGGAKELFHFVQKHFDVTLKKLDTNYRSRCNIVKFVNETFRDIIKGYSDQKCFQPDQSGYVKVSIKEDLLENIIQEVFNLLKKGVTSDDIAILTYTNGDAFLIEEALLQKDPTLKITTQTTQKLINTPMVSAIIELLKYLYFKKEVSKANFLTKIGLSWDSEIDFKDFHTYTPLPQLIKQIISTFDLPGEDTNILKLLEIASNYKDIESFLFESESINVDSPAKKSEGIKILTVHKSKGLEFKHIIVADRFTKKSPDRSTLIFSYDEITLKEIFVRTSKRDCVDHTYKNAIEKEKQLTHEDELNVLYVAFTRAKDSLIICQKEEASAFGILGLDTYEKGEVKADKKAEINTQTPKLIYKKQRLGLQENKLQSQIESDHNIYAINFGIAMHYMLEIIENFNIEKIDHAYWAMKNRYEMQLKDGDCEKIKDRVERLLNDTTFKELCKGSITKEQPMIYKKERKQIDLLIQKNDHYVIVDYKSSHELRSEHKTQVRHYKKAIEAITKMPVKAYLCYLREEEIYFYETT